MAELVVFEPTVRFLPRSISSRGSFLCKSKATANFLPLLGRSLFQLQSESAAGGVKIFAELAEFHIEMKRKKGMSAKHVRTFKSVSDSYSREGRVQRTTVPRLTSPAGRLTLFA